MRRLLLLAALALLAGCGGSASADGGLCTSQGDDLGTVRAEITALATGDHRWSPGEASTTTDDVGEAVTSLTSYVATDDRLARVVDQARGDLQALYEDLADDQTLAGDGQTVRTAQASLAALADTCAAL